MNIREILYLTDPLTDEQFEAAVAQVRSVRCARAEATMFERKMHEATGGLSTRRALEASPSGVARSLIASYVRAGMSPAQIDQALRGLRP